MNVSLRFVKPMALWLSVAFVHAACGSESADTQFTQANAQFAAGKFKDAISGYETLVKNGDWSPNLFYNLGNAYYRTSEFGRAILNYDRALALEPNHPEAQANLRLAREEARALEMAPSWADKALRFASLKAYTIAAALSFWIAMFLVVAFALSTRPRRSRLVLAIVCLVAAGFCAYLVRAIDHGPRGGSLGIITGGQTQARLATADTAASVLLLPAGSEVQIQQQRGDWVYAWLPNDQRGWIPSKSVEPVRLN